MNAARVALWCMSLLCLSAQANSVPPSKNSPPNSGVPAPTLPNINPNAGMPQWKAAVPPSKSEATPPFSPGNLVGVGEAAAESAAGSGAKGAKTLGASAKVLKGVGGVLNTLDIGESIYRSSECAKRGDVQGAKTHAAEAAYTALGVACPPLGVVQSVAGLASEVITGDDQVKKKSAEVMVGAYDAYSDAVQKGLIGPPAGPFTGSVSMDALNAVKAKQDKMEAMLGAQDAKERKEIEEGMRKVDRDQARQAYQDMADKNAQAQAARQASQAMAAQQAEQNAQSNAGPDAGQVLGQMLQVMQANAISRVPQPVYVAPNPVSSAPTNYTPYRAPAPPPPIPTQSKPSESTSGRACKPAEIDPKTGCHKGHNEKSHPGGCLKC